MNGFSADPGERTALVRSSAPARACRAMRPRRARGSRARVHRRPAWRARPAAAGFPVAPPEALQCSLQRQVQRGVRPAAGAAAMPRVAARGGAAAMRAVGTGVGAVGVEQVRARGRPRVRGRGSRVAAAAWRSGRSCSGRRGIATSSAACAGSSASGEHAEPGERAGADALQIAAERREGEPDVEHAAPADSAPRAAGRGRSRSAWSGGCAAAAPADGRPASPGSSRRTRCGPSAPTARRRGPGRADRRRDACQKRRSSTATAGR